MSYAHLGLRDWPFRIVPEPEFCDFLADRSQLRKDVAELVASLSTRPTSDIQLLWSWYGAGKTHTLFFLANQCIKQSDLLPIYVELPREASSFIDLYRLIIPQFPVEQLIDCYLEHTTRPATRTAFTRALDADLNSALTQAALGERAIQLQLSQWLLGNALTSAHYRMLGVGGRISTTEKCAAILADIVSLFVPRVSGPSLVPGGDSQASPAMKRVIWIIDEIQRVEDLRPSTQRGVLSGLVGVFNKCPTGLTLLLSYSGAPNEKSLPEWIPADLADRIGLERPMLIPPLGTADAKVFVSDLIRHFRAPEAPHLAEFHPFEPAAIDELIHALNRTNDLKPRSIMEALDTSLRNLEPALRSKELKAISPAKLRESLMRLSLDWGDGPSRKEQRAKK